MDVSHDGAPVRSPAASAAGSSEPLLRVENLRKIYSHSRRRSVTAVDNVSFTVASRQTLGIVGESGSGKTTTGLCILQLVRATSGSVLFEGQDLVATSRGELRRRRRDMQMIFQDPYLSLDPRMSLSDIVEQPLHIHRIGSRTSRRARVRELLDLVGISQRLAGHRAHELSGGQRQRVGIARALALNPKLIVCDEPVSALDVSIQAQIINLLRDLQRDLELTYVFISHDLAVVRTMSDQIAVMQSGRIVEYGDSNSVYRSPQHEYTHRLLSSVLRPMPR